MTKPYKSCKLNLHKTTMTEHTVLKGVGRPLLYTVWQIE